MSSNLTPTQQGTVQRARQFWNRGGDPVQTDAHNFGAALAHLLLLLEVIDELTGGAS